MSDKKLKPCPFCGGEAEYTYFAGKKYKHDVICIGSQDGPFYDEFSHQHKCDLCPSTCMFLTKEDARKAWNTRPAEEDLQDKIKELESELEIFYKQAKQEFEWEEGIKPMNQPTDSLSVERLKEALNRKLVWFSCGAASAVAAKLAVDKYPDCEVLYCDTLAYEHKDNLKFLKDVSKWIGKDITILKSKKYSDIYDVFEKTGWLIGVGGARCTTELKKNVRKQYQLPSDIHIFGLTADEENRIDNFEDANPELKLEWILADNKIIKDDCYRILNEAGIQIPAMYKLGYNNNNCIGCVKGQMGYWNKIRIDFPDAFNRMAKLERKMNVAICKSYAGDGKRKRVFLDELDPKAGRGVPLPNIECGVMCINENSREEAKEQLGMRMSVRIEPEIPTPTEREENE